MQLVSSLSIVLWHHPRRVYRVRAHAKTQVFLVHSCSFPSRLRHEVLTPREPFPPATNLKSIQIDVPPPFHREFEFEPLPQSRETEIEKICSCQTPTKNTPSSNMGSSLLFRSIATRPWPFMLILPCILIVFAAVGWTRDDIIEEEVYNIWTPTSSEFAKDKLYLESLGEDETTVTTFAAMAISRDGGNLFTESRLEEIRMRMEKVEATTVRKRIILGSVDTFFRRLCISIRTSSL
jgi:hypothetical protein